MTPITWRLVALGLAAACIGLPVFVYYRDWESPRSASAERAQAEIDARLLATALGHRDGCRRCAVKLVARTSPGHWLMALRGPATTRCFDLALDAFAPRPGAGFAGVSVRACPAGVRGSF